MSSQLNKNIFSEYHNEWACTLKKMINNHDNCFRIYKNIDMKNEEYLYNRRMKSLKSVRKIYLFLNRTKPLYFSFRSKMLKFWRTVYRKRNEFIMEINENLMIKAYNDKERNYLSLFKRTLEKYDPTYGIQIGLILHSKLNRDVALLINEYL